MLLENLTKSPKINPLTASIAITNIDTPLEQLLMLSLNTVFIFNAQKVSMIRGTPCPDDTVYQLKGVCQGAILRGSLIPAVSLIVVIKEVISEDNSSLDNIEAGTVVEIEFNGTLGAIVAYQQLGSTTVNQLPNPLTPLEGVKIPKDIIRDLV